MAIKTIQLLVEGVNDLDFLGNYLLAVFQAKLLQREGKNKVLLEISGQARIEIRTPLQKGWGYIKTDSFVEDLRQADALGHVSLVILDADIDGIQHDGGYQKRTHVVNQIQQTCHAQGLSFEYFLWPNDNDDGQLETALEQIMAKECQVIYNCIKAQESCIKQVIERQPEHSFIRQKVKLSLDKDVLKDNMKIFKDRVGDKTGNKFDRNRGFQNQSIWNLQHPALQPLRDFLTQHL